jgi:hypothetical protein
MSSASASWTRSSSENSLNAALSLAQSALVPSGVSGRSRPLLRERERERESSSDSDSGSFEFSSSADESTSPPSAVAEALRGPSSTARTAGRCAVSTRSCGAAPWLDRIAPGSEEKRRVLPRPLVGSGCSADAPAGAPSAAARGAAWRLKSIELAGDVAGDPKCCCIIPSKPERSSSMCKRLPLRFSRFSLSARSCSAAAKRSFAFAEACACPAFAFSAESCASSHSSRSAAVDLTSA